MLILLGVPLLGELCPIHQGCHALTFALARLSCYRQLMLIRTMVTTDFRMKIEIMPKS